MFDGLAARAGSVPTDIINQPSPKQPPGTESLTIILSWALYGVMFLSVLGIFIVAGAMVISHNQGRGSDHMSKLGFIIGGMILAGAAAFIVTRVMG
jgi:hypothetical protein